MGITLVSNQTAGLLALSSIKGIGQKSIIEALPSINPENLQYESLKLLSKRWNKKLTEESWMAAKDAALTQINNAYENNTFILSLIDESFPVLLKNSISCPLFIYVKGDITQHNNNCIALDGNINPTNHAEIVTYRVSQYINELPGCCLVTAIKPGCCTIAANTIDSGLILVTDNPIDTENNPVAQRGRLLISVSPFGSRANRGSAVCRDRVAAGLSSRVVLTQTDGKEHSLHMAKEAIRSNRTLHPVGPTDKDRLQNPQNCQGSIKLVQGLAQELCEDFTPYKKIIPITSRADYNKL